MSPARPDPLLTPAVRRSRTVLTLSSVGLTGILVGLVLISDGSTDGVVGLLGMALVVTGPAVLALDGWWRFPRPAPRVVEHRGRGALCLRASWMTAVGFLMPAVGVNLICVSFLMAPGGLQPVAEGQTRGALLYVVVPLAPLFLLGAIFLALRRNRVLLAPDSLEVRQHGRTRTVGWDSVGAVAPVPDDLGLGLRIEVVEGKELVVLTRYLGLDLLELEAVVRHLSAVPRDRDLLAGPSARQDVESWAARVQPRSHVHES